MTYKKRPIPISWKVFHHLMISDPNFITRYTRKGSLVVDKETNEVVYVIVNNPIERRGLEDVYER